MFGLSRQQAGAVALMCTFAAGIPGSALAWGGGTHAYIAAQTNKKGGLVSERQMCRRVFGANGPDLFNEVFLDAPQWLADVLHAPDVSPNLAPWRAAATDDEKTLGFGFATHNNAWGTDSTAHTDGVTRGNDNGYVIEKAAVVGDQIYPVLAEQFPTVPEVYVRALARQIAHNLVEWAVDFLLAEAAPWLGPDLAGSASCYDPVGDPDFLAGALGPWFAPLLAEDPDVGTALAQAWIRSVLPEFVEGLAGYGQVLSLPYPVALPAFAAATAPLAADYLAYSGFEPPPLAELESLVAYGVDVAKTACQGDYLEEIKATVGRVNGQTSALKISP